MFEDSLLESQGRLSTLNQGWTAWISVGLQCTLAAALVALPLLHPEALPFRVEAPRVLSPLLKRPPIVVQHVPAVRASAASAASVPVVGREFRAPGRIPHGIDTAPGEAPGGPRVGMGEAMRGDGPALPGMGEGGPGVRVVLASPPRAAGPVKVSAGVSAGLLLEPIRPAYPTIAKAAGVQGAVVVEAVISRAGRVESLRVISGPPMLQSAALEALRAARYRPYRLNGEPTEVETIFTISFRMRE